jgi:predicted amidohydrolase YtcJ
MTEIDLVLVNGRIRTLDPDRPSATALAVADGVLVAVAPMRRFARGAPRRPRSSILTARLRCPG